MPDIFKLLILTPDRRFYDDEADEVVFTTPEGRVGIMAGHQNMVAAVSEDTIEIRKDGQWRTAAVSKGFTEIFGDRVEFYVDTVEWSDEIDAARARDALLRAEELLKTQLDRVEHLRIQTKMMRAIARIKAVESASDR